jgi:Xaa-Pro dipeptidase
MNEKICKDHITKIRAELKSANADCFFAFSGSNINYSSGCNIGPSDRLAAAIIPMDGEVAIISPGFEGERMRKEKLFGEVYTWEEDEDPFDLVASIFKKMGLTKSCIAVDDTLWFRVYERMKTDSPQVKWTNGIDVIKRARWRKSEDELQLMEKACEYAVKGMELAIKQFNPGMTELDFSSIVSEKIYEVGKVHGGALVQSGPNASFPHNPTTKRVMQVGDAVVLDFGCMYQGYCADISRTLLIGKVDDEVKKCWQINKDAQQAAIDAVKPGVTCESIDKAARDYIDKKGYGKYFLHRTGHGIGMDGHEHPYIVNGNKEILEPGMCFTIEPGIYVANKFGMRIEDDVAVTESGPRLISKMKKDWAATI